MKDLTVAQALEKSQAMEVASKETKNFQQPEMTVPSAGIWQEDSYAHAVSRDNSCYRCGNSKHIAAACPHKNKQCNSCGELGHLARVCRSTGSKTPKHKRSAMNRTGRTHMVEASLDGACERDDDDELFDVGIHKVGQGMQ